MVCMVKEAKVDESKILCPICGSSGLQVFYSVIDVPASCNRLWKIKADAVNCPKGDIKLAFCTNCTFVSNVAIEPQKNQYDNQYDNSLFYSAHFQEFAKRLAACLVQRYNLYNKNIVEVGGGKVDFLSIMIDLGNNRGSKFDPFHSQVETSMGKISGIPKLDPGSFPFISKGKKIDFIFSYHELEHMNDPKSFLKDLRKIVDKSGDVRVFFSVPNVMKDFEEGEYSDIIYEHVSYFTIPSLRFLFLSCGFDISSMEETKGEIFDSIYVDVTLKQEKLGSNLKPASEFEVSQIEQRIRQFAKKTDKNIKELSQQLAKLLDEGNRIVVWGAGARGVTFLNIFGDRRIEYAVDINPHKHDMYIPGTGQKIVSPEVLSRYKPDFIVLANPAYQKEIEHLLTDMKLHSRLIPL
jgi:hypothetical protein